MTVEGTPLPSAASGPTTPHLSALNRGALRAATLDVVSGTTKVDIRVADLAGKLLVATTPAASTQVPVLGLSSPDVVTLQLGSSGAGSGVSAVAVVLDASVRWTIDLDGGAREEVVDMRGGHLVLLDLGAGTTCATVTLPARRGTQLVRESGGASELTVTAPPSVSRRVTVSGGAGSVRIGSVTHTGVGSARTFVDVGYLRAPQRLDVELQGGVSAVRIR